MRREEEDKPLIYEKITVEVYEIVEETNLVKFVLKV